MFLCLMLLYYTIIAFKCINKNRVRKMCTRIKNKYKKYYLQQLQFSFPIPLPANGTVYDILQCFNSL